MNAIERIEAARARLTELRDAAGYSEVNGWLVESANECTCAGGVAETSYMHEPGCGYQPVTNDPLMVTLHRSIDAQLDMFDAALTDSEPNELAVYPDGRPIPQSRLVKVTASGCAAVRLADVILGDAA